MSRRISWCRIALGCALAIAGCGREEQTEPAAASKPATPPPPAAATGSCAELAQALCERTPLECDAANGLLAHAQLGQDDCTAARDELIATDDLGPDMRGRAQAEVIAKLMKTSPVVKPEHVDALMAESNAKAGAAGDGDPSCPGIATKKGKRPPDGGEMWCETPQGERHGPSLRWNAEGELVRTIEYRHGVVASVRYTKPASGDMPMALFVCPEGETVKQDQSEGMDIRYCEKDGQRGIVGFWKDGKLRELDATTPRAGGPPQNRFVGYMEQPE